MVDRRSQQRRRLYAQVPQLPPVGEIDLSGLFGDRETERELEIGFGRARFLLARAEQEPGVRLLGIETRRKWVHRAAERTRRRGLPNVLVRCGDAREALSRMRPDASLARIFVNFPDPWWKARHAKRLVVGEDLLEQIARLLVDGGELFVQTDVEFRADSYREALSACPELRPASGDGTPKRNPYGAMSSREIRCRELGLPIHRLLFRRIER
ncbi:MAG: tRNA (guanosine(46)-N7)-methyltransferase TrmB [Polyangia bacterium]